ncbi:MAG TPA: VOC family protein [Rhizomicrobium sp.]|jgi:catechol 2,3-dioxygenase-like lactoylglutathione lyase family enzyme|nr:VOC family protein [Rhizomicrobium sp.]
MIGYATVGTNDMERASKYYDALLGEFDAKQAWDNGRVRGYVGPYGMFAIATPHDGEAATVGNGSMFAFRAKDREMVDRVYAKAMELGSKDEGAPGARTDNFYGAYFRDPDGNKLCVFKAG